MFEIAMVNEPSVFEPLKFYCIAFQCKTNFSSTNEHQKQFFTSGAATIENTSFIVMSEIKTS